MYQQHFLFGRTNMATTNVFEIKPQHHMRNRVNKVLMIYKEIIANLKEISPTLLVIEENPTRLQNIADYIYLLDDGEFVWQGKPEELRKNESIINTYLGI